MVGIFDVVLVYRSWPLVYWTTIWYIFHRFWYSGSGAGLSYFFFYFVCPDTDTSISVVVSVRDTGLSDLVFIISDEVLVHWTLFAVYLTWYWYIEEYKNIEKGTCTNNRMLFLY